jgi:hypothetical protein
VLLTAALLGTSPGCTSDEEPWIELFPDDAWQDTPPGTLVELRGVVRHETRRDAKRFNPYKLERASGELTDIHCAGSDALAPYVGASIVLEGKLVPVTADGQVSIEIWPWRARHGR